MASSTRSGSASSLTVDVTKLRTGSTSSNIGESQTHKDPQVPSLTAKDSALSNKILRKLKAAKKIGNLRRELKLRQDTLHSIEISQLSDGEVKYYVYALRMQAKSVVAVRELVKDYKVPDPSGNMFDDDDEEDEETELSDNDGSHGISSASQAVTSIQKLLLDQEMKRLEFEQKKFEAEERAKRKDRKKRGEGLS